MEGVIAYILVAHDIRKFDKEKGNVKIFKSFLLLIRSFVAIN